MLSLGGRGAFAQEAGIPQPPPLPPSITSPRDVAYPGTIRLSVDATDLDRHIFRISETIPVAAPGPLTLLFAKWLPGYHSPDGPLDQLAGLQITAGGRRLEWVWDGVEMNDFHVTVPPGAAALDLEYQYLSPVEGKEGRIVMTPDMLNLEWNAVTLYPAGYYATRIPVAADLRLPEAWSFGTALETAGTAGGVTKFQTVSLDTLVDSPLFAGRYFKQLDLDPCAAVPVRLNLVADQPEYLEVTPAQLTAHRNLVKQAYKLFGSRHYDHYDFLVALTDNLGGIGLEHHRSSENSVTPKYFTDWDKTFLGRDLLAHEYTHSWNGKFRRPADLWTPDFNVPMRDSLLWVYEGQTQYWGYVLAARAGLLTPVQALDAIAAVAAAYDHREGRAWRALQDTTNDPIITDRRPLAWRSWQRSEDYYSEGQLIWLDADTLIRTQTGGAKSLDDFARAFFGIEDGSYAIAPYDFDDVVRTLNRVMPHDWAGFLRTRLDGHGPGAPLDGLKRGGYQLTYTDTPSEFTKAIETRNKTNDLTYSLGLIIGKDGALTDVAWNGPAFKVGLAAGVQLMAVNNIAYTDDGIKAAIKAAAQEGAKPLELLVKSGDRYRTINLEYHEGLRYPHLERIAGTPALLDAILTARP